MANDPTASIPTACGGGWGETKAAYRLLDNPKLDFREVLRAHSMPTLERIRQEGRVLCLQDTTEVDFSGRPGMAGLGRLLGTIAFELPASGKRPARRVEQTLRVTRVELRSRKGPGPGVTVILAREENPPAGQQAIEWCLITNEPITTLSEAQKRIEWYRKRWWIEVYFQILKSGCRIQALQLRTFERLERALVLYLIVAWRILLLMTIGREHPEWSCEIAFSPEEWKTAWVIHHRRPPPSVVPDLGRIVRIVAGFGGWLGRKNDPPPGPKALWQGMAKLSAYVDAMTVMQEVEVTFPPRKRVRH